jgi:hypothetical protein
VRRSRGLWPPTSRSLDKVGYHFQKVADLFNRLSNLLEADRKAQLSGSAILSEQEQKIAYGWAGKLWQALNKPDVTGRVSAAINATPQSSEKFTNAINNGRTYAVRNITGDTFTQNPGGSYSKVTAPEGAPGDAGAGAGGLLESLGILDFVLPVLVDPHDPLMGMCEITPGCQQMVTGPGGPLYQPPSI